MSHTPEPKASHYITMHKCFTESDLSNNGHQSQQGLLSKSGFPELTHKKINSCVLQCLTWGSFSEAKKDDDRKKEGLTRNREDNQLSLQSNTHKFLKKKDKQDFLWQLLTPCWSFFTSASEPLLSLCVSWCVCGHTVLDMGVFQMTDLHTNSLSKFTEGKCVCVFCEIVCLPSSGAEGLQFNSSGRSHYQLPALDIACGYMHYVRSGLTHLNFSLSKEGGRTIPNQPAQSQMSSFPEDVCCRWKF